MSKGGKVDYNGYTFGFWIEERISNSILILRNQPLASYTTPPKHGSLRSRSVINKYVMIISGLAMLLDYEKY